eukprot:CAMPEP_0113698414 /NCGR_PEP_ID=MMETSP0038_2-20120614/22701_1 /TAXON_ID=2898 /ORGANISM="Cryptomonas paramecium" /LENGTH=166 /DNA_ID=CAMNT_0000621583 /DNA_START=930 /DNA_END=1426 /DNA_ORIENTATION=- /assembly_acc=CAM_ASM_000170
MVNMLSMPVREMVCSNSAKDPRVQTLASDVLARESDLLVACQDSSVRKQRFVTHGRAPIDANPRKLLHPCQLSFLSAFRMDAERKETSKIGPPLLQGRVVIPDVQDPTTSEALLGSSCKFYLLLGTTAATEGSLEDDGAKRAKFDPLLGLVLSRSFIVFGLAIQSA